MEQDGDPGLGGGGRAMVRWHPGLEPTGQGRPFGHPPGLEGAPLSAASGRMLTLGSSHCLHPLELVPLCPWGFCFGAGLFLLG